MRYGKRKLLGIFILILLFNFWAFTLINAPINVNNMFQENFESDLISTPQDLDENLHSQDNLDESTSDINEALQNIESTSSFYKYKPEELLLANNTFNYLLEQSQNQTDFGFLNYVNLTGGANDTIKTTQAAALAILAGLELMITNISNSYILNKTIEIANFMINNLIVSVNGTNYYAFCTNISDDLSLQSNFVNTTDNSLAIYALTKLYTFEKNVTYVQVANDTLTYLNDNLWDDEYGGYFNSNHSINGSKVTRDNLLAALANIELVSIDYYDYEYRINARNRAKSIMNYVIEYLYNNSKDEGIGDSSNRYWNVTTNNNEALTNGLAAYSLLSCYRNIDNSTYLEVSENISHFIDLNLFDAQRGLFNSTTTNSEKKRFPLKNLLRER